MSLYFFSCPRPWKYSIPLGGRRTQTRSVAPYSQCLFRPTIHGLIDPLSFALLFPEVWPQGYHYDMKQSLSDMSLYFTLKYSQQKKGDPAASFPLASMLTMPASSARPAISAVRHLPQKIGWGQTTERKTLSFKENMQSLETGSCSLCKTSVIWNWICEIPQSYVLVSPSKRRECHWSAERNF